MKIGGLILLNLFVLQTIGIAQDSIQARIVLIGDAGQLTKGRHPVVSAVKNNITLDKKTTIIFLGDNLYKTGLPDNTLPTYDIAKAPLDSQIQIAGKSDAKVYFVPGLSNSWSHHWLSIITNVISSVIFTSSGPGQPSRGNISTFLLPR